MFLAQAAAIAVAPGFPQGTASMQALSSLSTLHSPLLLQFRVRPATNSLSSFTASNRGWSSKGRAGVVVVCKSTDERTPPTAETNPLVKLAWYGSEAFGKAVAGFRPKQPDDGLAGTEEETLAETGPVERKDAVELLRADLDRSYFVTGNMATNIYEEDCEFADPFVSFKGLKRFKQNVGNLGSFMEESSLKLLDWQEYEDRIFAKWRFNCVLALPWRPVLAASGSTEYFFKNDSGKIYKHIETWDISPVDGLRQLFRPNPKKKSKQSSSS